MTTTTHELNMDARVHVSALHFYKLMLDRLNDGDSLETISTDAFLDMVPVLRGKVFMVLDPIRLKFDEFGKKGAKFFGDKLATSLIACEDKCNNIPGPNAHEAREWIEEALG